VRQLLDALQRKIARAPLHVRDVGPVQASAIREFFLGNSQLRTLALDGSSEQPLKIDDGHAMSFEKEERVEILMAGSTDDE
jgi:hypothetical protein